MSNGRILIVEDDFDISNMLRIFFTGQGYLVEVAARGSEAMEICRKKLPDLIVLDIMLPDMDGFAVCEKLRTTSRTKYIPIIFLTQRDERSDKIAGLELGADDYITKPFDIEELKLRVRQSISTHKRQNMTDPITGLPSSRLIEDELRTLMSAQDWSYLHMVIDNYSPFKDVYGFVTSDEVLRFTSMLLNEVVDELGTVDDFIGHPSNDTFILITTTENIQTLVEKIRTRFNEGILSHYNFMDREQGGIELPNGDIAPLMKLSIGVVSEKSQQFSDIREITEMAAELRRIDQRNNH
ncbi:MAG: response regulator [Chloroflexota bacterium]